MVRKTWKMTKLLMVNEGLAAVVDGVETKKLVVALSFQQPLWWRTKMIKNIWKKVMSLGAAHEEGEEWAVVADGVGMNVWLKLLRNVTKLEKAYLECKGCAVMAGGVKMNVRLKVECKEWASGVDDVELLNDKADCAF